MARDLILTWPKSTALRVYLETLEQAHARMDVINFRVASPPLVEDGEVARVYMVHDGKIRGWNAFLGIEFRAWGEVQQARGGGYWPEGWYIVRSALWHPLHSAHQIPMRGFQGFRYMDQCDTCAGEAEERRVVGVDHRNCMGGDECPDCGAEWPKALRVLEPVGWVDDPR